MHRRARAFVALLNAILILSVATVGVSFAEEPEGEAPEVITATDATDEKLHPKLQAEAASGSTEDVAVFVTVSGDTAETADLLQDTHVAAVGDVALIVGRLPANQLSKLASFENVLAVGPIELRQTGEPLGIPDPELNVRPDAAALQAAIQTLRRNEVPYSRARQPRGSNFEDLMELAVLDARTHAFAEAWEAGFTGEGVTVGVLDGGTDFAHPDLLGTWRLWSTVTETGTRDDGWSGWPMAFDPYGTLVWLVDPGAVDLGLTWYTWTEAKDEFTQNRQDRRDRLSRVSFDTRTGPARNFAAPNDFNTHEYTFPTKWTKSGTVRMGSHPDDHLLLIYGERPAFIVVDPNTAGVYDTVYVDLDGDQQFADEKPITKASPASYRDMNNDGLTDISGGLLYYISDGETRIPGGVTSFGMNDAPVPGELLAWTGDYDPAIGGHGTSTASNIVGQGVINGLAPCFADLRRERGAERCPGGGTYPGAVIGGAPEAKLAPFGDIYFSFEFSTQFAYFLSNLRGVDITSNSYGSSDVDNDGYDAASQEADLWHSFFGGRTTPLFSTGNGAPGYGTSAPPSPFYGIAVGASTQFGGTGWDSIRNYSQVVDNEVMVWSNRGPGATGSAGVDVVADGAFSAGDVTLNAVLDGDVAWNTWGGTSRSAPVAAGATALIYQAWRSAHGPTVPVDFALTAKEILKSSAEDLGYDSFTQGAGSVDAAQAVATALGTGSSVSPSEWRVGDYRGEEWDVFTHVIAPGETDIQTFSTAGPGTYAVSDRFLSRTDSIDMTFTSSNVSRESPYTFNAPDYLIDISSQVAAHPNADLMVVRLNHELSTLDLDGDYVSDNEWRLLTYNWTDINRNGRLTRDRDRDGVVDHVTRSRSSNIDGFADIDFRRSEIEEGEYVRFMYHRAGANTLQSFVRNPADLMADGLFIGLQHFARSDAAPTTTFDIRIDFYENADWSWVSTPAVATGAFDATVTVPDGTPNGMYAGAVVLTETAGDETIVVPVVVNVAPSLAVGDDGNLPVASFGGEAVADAQAGLTYNNGAVFGATDWTWRAESGDWRFFYFDVEEDPDVSGDELAEGTLFLADTTWLDAAPPTDLDTLIFGPGSNGWQVANLFGFPTDPIGAPYILETVGGSPNTNVGAGVWTFDTATGGNREVVVAPAQHGLHAVVQHQVLFNGGQFWAPFGTTLGTAAVSPSSVVIDSATDSGSFEVTFRSTLDLDGISAEAFGLSQPSTTTETAQQDDPNDPSSSSVKKNVTIEHASTAYFQTDLEADIDLFVVYDANGDGVFTNEEIIAASQSGTGHESIEIIRPADGAYQVWVQGWAVPTPQTFPLLIDIVQGVDLDVSGVPAGPVPAGTTVTLTVSFDKAMVVGETYKGELVMGPSVAPSALRIPIQITRVAGP